MRLWNSTEMRVAMGRNASAKAQGLNEHQLRNALAVAAVVLAPSVALILLGLTRSSG